jgi:hypothetical protein
MRTSTLTMATEVIAARGTRRDREVCAYLLAYGRFADVLALAATIDAPNARHLTIVAA